MDLKSILEEKYLFNIKNIIKNEDSTYGNVYMVNTINNKYVIKIYNNLDKVNMMTSIHNLLIDNHFNVPEVIKTNGWSRRKRCIFYRSFSIYRIWKRSSCVYF